MKTELIAISAQINFFLTTSTLSAEPSSILKLMPFIEKGFFPGFVDVTSDNGVKSKNLRIEREQDSVNLTVTFGNRIININIDALQSKSLNVESLISNYKFIIELLKETFKDVSLKSNRVAVVLNEGYKYDPDFESAIHNKFFKDETIPFEWSFRRADRGVIAGEAVFNVKAAQRGFAAINIKGNLSETEALLISVDNNTVPENTDARFSFDNDNMILELINKTYSEMSKIKEL